LPDRDVLAQALEHARCTRNVSRIADVTAAAQHCATALASAERARPPQLALANAERTRLGHFQRLLGDPVKALVTLRHAVDEAVRVFGPDHPDTAIARYTLGIALISTDAPDQIALGITQLQTALAIRRASFPQGGPAVAESLQGLGDALASAGRHAEAVPLLEDGLAMLERAHAGTTAEAVNLHILAGMSLEELHRNKEALVHDLAAADIADRSLEHREELAAMALRLAANVEAADGRAAVGLVDAERALRLLDRGHGSPAAIGKTQLVIAELAAATHDPQRARAMAVTARATLLAAGDAGKEDLAEVDAFLRTHH
ncbi:MAG TPA: tetratricopeptide repeat protein, partial [Kofleriaceae bacterium]